MDVQSYYLGFIVFGMSLTLGVIDELQRPGEMGAYNARLVLALMVQGLEDELDQRLKGFNIKLEEGTMDGPSIDADGFFEPDRVLPSNIPM